MSRFKGLITRNKRRGPYNATDAELTKMDILHELQTRRGSRIMNVTYGSNLHLYLGEPNVKSVQDAVRDDVIQVIERDPRVRVMQVSVELEEHAIKVGAQIEYVPNAVTDNLYLIFTEQTGI